MHTPSIRIVARACALAAIIPAFSLTHSSFAAVRADFAQGAGSVFSDQYPGLAADGWISGWTAPTTNIASSSVNVQTTSPLSVDGTNYIAVSATGGSTYSYPTRFTLRRQFSGTPSGAGVDLTQPHEFSWRFRLDSPISQFENGGDWLYFACKSDSAPGSGSGQTWGVTATGGNNPTWSVSDGTGSGGGTYINTGLPLESGAIYDFRVTVYPGTSWATSSWDITITGPHGSYIKTGLHFRNTTLFTSGTWLQFTTEATSPNEQRGFSLDSVRLAPHAPEETSQSDSFVESLGICTHVSDPGMPYDAALFGGLGIRHFRDNTIPDQAAADTRQTALYNSYGIKVNLVVDHTTYAPSVVKTKMEEIYAESVESLNEPDLRNRSYGAYTDTNTSAYHDYPATRLYHSDLVSAMATLSGGPKPVLSPAMGQNGVHAFLRPCTYDINAAHFYPPGQTEMPGRMNLESYCMALADQARLPSDPVAPLYLTETGYITAPNGIVSDSMQGKYLPRILAECYLRGFTRAYIYQMIDGNPAIYTTDNGWGLLRYDYTLKPSYTAIKNLITHLSDSTWNTSLLQWNRPAFTPTPLDCVFTQCSPTVHHLAFQKNNGDYYLLLWRETTDGAPSETVRIAFNHLIASAARYTLSSMTPTDTYGAFHTLDVSVPPEIVVLKITPDQTVPTYGDPNRPIISVSVAQNPVSGGGTGYFAVNRAGSTANAVTVNYTVEGDAVAGTHYTALPGSVTLPAGVSSVTIPVTQLGVSNYQGSRSVTLRLNADTAYYVAPHYADYITLSPGAGLIADFEGSTPLANWTAAPRSTLAVETTNVDSGAKALKWTYNDDGVTQWSNNIRLTFGASQNWTTARKLVLRFALNPSNSREDAPQMIAMDLTNNGVSTSNSKSVAVWDPGSDSGYRTVVLDLADFARDQVQALNFYVNGNGLSGSTQNHFDVGNHIWYLDNIYVY